jgi:carboxymethylenebutenolidase
MLLHADAFGIEKTMLYGLGAKKNMQAELIMPDGEGPFPAILILHTSGGVQDGEIIFARELAEQGYACLIPYYFDAYNISHSTRQTAATKYAENIFNDFSELLEYLKKNPKIKADRLGAVGFSMGGYWALVLAAKGRVKAAVSYYGALSGGGKNLDLKYRFENVFTKESSPVLILHGSQDQIVSVRLAYNLFALLDEKKSPYELRIYDGAEHRYERQPNRDENAANDSWKRTLEFLKRQLKDK